MENDEKVSKLLRLSKRVVDWYSIYKPEINLSRFVDKLLKSEMDKFIKDNGGKPNDSTTQNKSE